MTLNSRGPYWVGDASDLRTVYLDTHGKVSLGEVLEYISENYPQVNLKDVQVNGCLIVRREATEKELKERKEWRESRVKKHEEWELSTLAKLKAKYEGNDSAT